MKYSERVVDLNLSRCHMPAYDVFLAFMRNTSARDAIQDSNLFGEYTNTKAIRDEFRIADTTIIDFRNIAFRILNIIYDPKQDKIQVKIVPNNDYLDNLLTKNPEELLFIPRMLMGENMPIFITVDVLINKSSLDPNNLTFMHEITLPERMSYDQFIYTLPEKIPTTIDHEFVDPCYIYGYFPKDLALYRGDKSRAIFYQTKIESEINPVTSSPKIYLTGKLCETPYANRFKHEYLVVNSPSFQIIPHFIKALYRKNRLLLTGYMIID